MNKFLKVVKMIGEKIISVVEWPFKHSVALERILADVKKDTPATCDALVGLVQRFEALGVDALEAIAEKGLDIPEDMKVGADLKALFSHFMTEVCPAIEKECADVKNDLHPASSTVANGEAGSDAPAAPAPQPGPGLATIVPD